MNGLNFLVYWESETDSDVHTLVAAFREKEDADEYLSTRHKGYWTSGKLIMQVWDPEKHDFKK